MQKTTTVGLDLAKSIFQVHGVDAQQGATLARQIRRKDMHTFFAKLPPCLVGMEACGSAHYWARELTKLGHTVRLLVPRDVKAYVRRGKTDAADAAAICEAVTRAHVGTVTVKSEAQQCLLMLHKSRDLLLAARTTMVNALRAHLAELGVVAPAGHAGFALLCSRLETASDAGVPAAARVALLPMLAALRAVECSIAAEDVGIRAAHRQDATSRRIEQAKGFGLMAATAFAASADSIRTYRSARSFAASLGLTPRISGTGGVVTLGSISKQGNGYLRRLLYLGAVSRLAWARRNPAKADPKLLRLLQTKAFKVAACALANKMARVVWALVVRGGAYVADHKPVGKREVVCQ